MGEAVSNISGYTHNHLNTKRENKESDSSTQSLPQIDSVCFWNWLWFQLWSGTNGSAASTSTLSVSLVLSHFLPPHTHGAFAQQMKTTHTHMLSRTHKENSESTDTLTSPKRPEVNLWFSMKFSKDKSLYMIHGNCFLQSSEIQICQITNNWLVSWYKSVEISAVVPGHMFPFTCELLISAGILINKSN